MPAAHRLGACIGVPIMATAVAAVAFHRHRGGPVQDLELDLRQAIHGINPAAFWHPTLNGRSFGPAFAGARQPVPAHALPHRGRLAGSMASRGLHPHLAAEVVPGSWTCHPTALWSPPPSPGGTRSSWKRRPERRGPPGASVLRTPGQCGLAHPHGSPLRQASRSSASAAASATPCRATPWPGTCRPFVGCPRVLSFTHAIAGPVVGRTLAEHGADVLCATRPNDYEHGVHLRRGQPRLPQRVPRPGKPRSRAGPRAAALLADADIVVSNHRQRIAGTPRPRVAAVTARNVPGSGLRLSHLLRIARPVGAPRRLRYERLGSLAGRHPSGTEAEPPAPRHRTAQRLCHRLPGSSRAPPPPWPSAPPREASWHVTVNLTRAATWCGSLGELVDPAPGFATTQNTRCTGAGPLRRFHPTGRRPHARPAGPVLHHRTRLASTASCPQRCSSRSRMADLTLPGAKAHATTEVRPHDRGGLLRRPECGGGHPGTSPTRRTWRPSPTRSRTTLPRRPLAAPLVNNAGVALNALIETLPIQEWRRSFRGELLRACRRHTGPARQLLVVVPRSGVVNISSVGGRVAPSRPTRLRGLKVRLGSGERCPASRGGTATACK